MEQTSDYRLYNEQLFHRYAPIYDSLVWPLKALRRAVVKLANVKEGQRVFDVACGTGAQSLAFAQTGCSVIGVDLSEDMLQRARAKAKPNMDIQFLQHDASALPYKTASFDLATISLGLHDMPADVRLAVLREMQRITKPDGKFIIVDYHKSDHLFSKVIHSVLARFESKWYHQFMENGLQPLLHEVGLKTENQYLKLFGAIEIAVCIPSNKS